MGKILRVWIATAIFSLSGVALAHNAELDSPPVITQAITKLIPRLNHAFSELEKGDLLVLDLDNTVFREVQMLGTDEWHAHAVHKIVARGGLGKKEAMDRLERVNGRIKAESAMKLMEPGLPALIADLQAKGVLVIGLTARHPNLAGTTIMHLNQLGISFQRSRFPEAKLLGDYRIPGLDHAFLWSSGVAFTDGSPKGTVLKALIERSGITPKRFIAIDDRIHHVHNFVEALLDLKIEGRVVHYLRVREEPEFDPAVADLQFRVFRRLGYLLSDDEARARLKPLRDRCAAALSAASAS